MSFYTPGQSQKGHGLVFVSNNKHACNRNHLTTLIPICSCSPKTIELFNDKDAECTTERKIP